MKRRRCGFSLIELLIALAIVAILSAIAWPGYGAMIQRAHRNDARFALLRLQQLQERHYATHLRYAGQLGTAADPDTLVAASRSEGGRYLLSITAAEDGQGYTATATVRDGGAQARDSQCRQLSVDHSGQRRSAGVTGAWANADPHRCWG
jgi:type IV pilus assembly protein PilE